MVQTATLGNVQFNLPEEGKLFRESGPDGVRVFVRQGNNLKVVSPSGAIRLGSGTSINTPESRDLILRELGVSRFEDLPEFNTADLGKVLQDAGFTTAQEFAALRGVGGSSIRQDVKDIGFTPEQQAVLAARNQPGTPQQGGIPISSFTAEQLAILGVDPSRTGGAIGFSRPTNQTLGNVQGQQQPSFRNVTVQGGDTLSAIAAREGISLQELLRNNPQFQSNPNLIFPGQEVKIPQALSDFADSLQDNRVEGAAPSVQGNVETVNPPQITFSDFNLPDISPSISSRDFNSLFTSPTTGFDIQNLLDENRQLRERFLQTLQPTDEETRLKSALADVASRADQLNLTLESRIADITDQPVSTRVQGTRSLAEEQKAAVQMRTIQVEEANLLRRLGLEQEARQAESNNIKALLAFAGEDVQTALQIQDRIERKQQAVLQQATQLRAEARQSFFGILEQFKGIRPSDLDPLTQGQLGNLAQSAGVPYDLVLQGMEAAADAADAAALSKASEKMLGGLTEQQINIMKSLSDDFEKATGEFQDVSASYNRIVASVTDPSAAGDLALIFNYMKMLDPGSVVREGEFANAQNSAGIPDRIRAQYNQVVNGQRLSTSQRNDFFNRAQKLYGTALEDHNRTVSQFEDRADAFSIPREFIVRDVTSLNFQDGQVGGGQGSQSNEQLIQTNISNVGGFINQAISENHDSFTILNFLRDADPDGLGALIETAIIEGHDPEVIIDFIIENT